MRSPAELVVVIRSMCKEHHTSLTKLEENFSWANGTIGKWAKGAKYPPHDKIQKIAEEFGVSTEYLLGMEIEDEYSIKFRNELLCVLESSGLSGNIECAGNINDLRGIINSTHPLSFREACDTAKKAGLSIDALIWNNTNDALSNKEKAPDTVKAVPRDRHISLEESDQLLIALGLIEKGQQLSDDDLAFLTHIVGLLEAWFGKGK